MTREQCSSGHNGAEMHRALSFGYNHTDFLQFSRGPFPAFLLALSPLSWHGFWRLTRGTLRPARVSIFCKRWEADTENTKGSAPSLTTTHSALCVQSERRTPSCSDCAAKRGFPWAQHTGTDPLTFYSPVTWDWPAGTNCSALEDKK